MAVTMYKSRDRVLPYMGVLAVKNGHFVMSIRHLWTRVMAPMIPWPCHLVAGQGLCQKCIYELTIHSLTMAFFV